MQFKAQSFAVGMAGALPDGRIVWARCEYIELPFFSVVGVREGKKGLGMGGADLMHVLDEAGFECSGVGIAVVNVLLVWYEGWG